MSVATTEKTEKELDDEWLDLILEARDLGLTVKDIKEIYSAKFLSHWAF
ncbi:anti-repressor SinI family protein [Neobacillus vireti]